MFTIFDTNELKKKENRFNCLTDLIAAKHLILIFGNAILTARLLGPRADPDYTSNPGGSSLDLSLLTH